MTLRPQFHIYTSVVGLSLELFLTVTMPAQDLKSNTPNQRSYSHQCLVVGTSQVNLEEYSQRVEFLTKTRNCMFQKGTNVPQGQLDADQKVIADAYPQVRAFYSKHSEKDSARILALAWAGYRSQYAAGALTKDKIIQ